MEIQTLTSLYQDEAEAKNLRFEQDKSNLVGEFQERQTNIIQQLEDQKSTIITQYQAQIDAILRAATIRTKRACSTF